MAVSYRVGVSLGVEGEKDFKKDLTQTTNYIRSLEKELDNLQAEQGSTADSIDNLAKQNELYTKGLEELKARLEQVQHYMDILGKDADANKNQLSRLNETKQKLITTMREFSNGQQQVERAMTSNTQAIQKNASQLEKLSTTLKTNKAQLDANKSALAENSTSTSLLSDRNKLLNERTQQLEQQQRLLKEQILLVGDAEDDTSQDTQELSQELAKNQQEITQTTAELKQLQRELISARAGFDQFKSAMDTVDNTLARVSSTITKVGAGLTATLTTALAGLGKSSIDSASNIESLHAQIATLAQSSETADRVIQEMYDFGVSSPYELNGLAETVRLLMNYGITADEAIRMTKMLGNVAMGDAGALQGIALAYAQMSASGKIMLQDVNQMVSNGFSPLLEISKKTGVSIGELRDTIKDGSVTFEDITEAIETATSEGGRYYGAMDRMANTFQGLWNNFHESLEMGFKKPIGDILIPYAERAMDAVGNVLNSFSTLDTGTQRAIVGLGAMTAAFPPLLIAIGGYGQAVAGIGLVTNNVFSAISTQVAKVTAFDLFEKNAGNSLKRFRGFLSATEFSIKNFSQLKDLDPNIMTSKFDKMFYGASKSFDSFKTGMSTLQTTFKNTVDHMAGYASQLSNYVPATLKNFATSVTEHSKTVATSTAEYFSSANRQIGNSIKGLNSHFPLLNELRNKIVGSVTSCMTGTANAITKGRGLIVNAFNSVTSAFITAYNSAIVQNVILPLAGVGKTLAVQYGEILNQAAQFSLKFTLLMSKTFMIGSIVGMLLAGLGYAKQQFGDYIDGWLTELQWRGQNVIQAFVTGIVSKIPDLVVQGGQLVTRFLQVLETLIPQAINAGIGALEGFVSGLSQVAPQLIVTFSSVIQTLISSIINNLPQMVLLGTELFLALMDGLSQAIPQLITLIPELLNKILDSVLVSAPVLIQTGTEIIVGFINGMVAALPQLLNQLPIILEKLVQVITDNLPLIINAGITILETLINAITHPDTLTLIINAIPRIFTVFLEGILNNLDTIINAGLRVLEALIDGVCNNLPLIIDAVITIIGRLLWAIVTHLPEILEAGGKILVALAQGIIHLSFKLVEAAGTLIGVFWDRLKNTDWIQLAKDMINGLVNAIKGLGSFVADAAKDIGTSILDGIKGVLKIQSPSRVMQEVGKNTVQGTVLGMKKMLPQVSKISKELGETIQKDTMRAATQVTMANILEDPVEKDKYLNVPEIKLPDYKIPEIEVPEVEVPEIKVPEVKVPAIEYEVPEVVTPEVNLPKLDTVMASMQTLQKPINTQVQVGVNNDSLVTGYDVLKEQVDGINVMLTDDVQNSWTTMYSGMTNSLNTTVSVMTSIYSLFTNNNLTNTQSFITTLTGLFTAFYANNESSLTLTLNNQTNLLTAFINNIQALITAMFTTLSTLITTFLNNVTNLLNTFVSQVIALITNMRDRVIALINDMVNQFIALIQQMVNTVVEKIRSMVEQVITALQAMPNGFYQVAVSCMNEFIRGMEETRASVTDKASQVVQDVINTFKHGLDINSPSRVMFSLGKFSMQGFLGGLSSEDVVKFSNNIVKQIVSSFAAGKLNPAKIVDFLDDAGAINNLIRRLRTLDFSDILKSVGNGQMIWPTTGDITSWFGLRDAPTAGASTNHGALDIANDIGTQIVAALAGTVVESVFQGEHTGYGNKIVIDHGGGWQTLYGHLSQRLVQVGQQVAQGALIGLMGSTGVSTGPHLHFGVYKDGVAVDPLQFLQGAPVSGVGSIIDNLINQLNTASLLKQLGAGVANMFGAATQSVLSSATALLQDSRRIGRYSDVIDYSPYTGGGSLDEWIAAALQITGQPMSELANLRSLIMGESGGNPNIIQSESVVDVNTLSGNPARGITQTIAETFKNYMLNGLNQIYNPIHNIVASIRYQLAVYGRLLNHSGYAVGTRYVPETFNTTVHKGEAILPAGQNPYTYSGGKYLEEIVGKVVRAIDNVGGGSNPQSVVVNQTFTDANPTPAQIARKMKNTLKHLNR